jgi:hypothetical protein
VSYQQNREPNRRREVSSANETGSKAYRQRVLKAKIGMWLASRASRNTGIVDRLCRRVLARLTKLDPADDFMRDDLIELDQAFDPEELARYQRGETE